MKINFQIEQEDLDCVKKLLREMKTCSFVVERHKNLESREPVEKEEFWKEMVCTRLTSQQKSSPQSPITQFSEEKPFLLNYALITKKNDIKSFVSKTLTEYKGIRHQNKIGDALDCNYHRLNENCGWDEMLRKVNSLIGKDDPVVEREVADYVRSKLKGFGPKQSRNLLQFLRLTRYGIPLDSRVTKWMNRNLDLPFPLNAVVLSDAGYYEFVLGIIQTLCRKCDTFPCILDASIFASFDVKK